MAPLVAFLPVIAAGVGAAAAGVELANMPSAPTAPSATTTATEQAEAASTAAQAQAAALAKRRGISATILTSPLGTTGTASTQKATLGA